MDEVSIVSKIRKLYIPSHIQLELTKHCNLRCGFCYAECDANNGLKKEYILRLLNEIKRMGTLELNFTGGEPLMRQDAFEIFEYAKQLGFSLTLNTNATLITSENVERLIKLFSKFEISLHSYIQEQQDQITGVVGSYQKVFNALELLKSTPQKVLLKCVLTNQTMNSWNLIQEYADKNHFACSFDMTITPTYSGDLSPSKYQLSNSQIESLISDHTELTYRVQEDVISNYLSKGKLSDGICSAARTSVFIDANGYCFPCVTFKTNPALLYHGKRWAETICEKNFYDIWHNNILFQKIRSILPEDFTKCLKCDIDHYCIKCIAKNLRETGDLHTPSADFCIMSHAKYGKSVSKYSVT